MKKRKRIMTKPLNFSLKVSEAELTRLKENAKIYQGGNLSGWLRRAGNEYKPVSIMPRLESVERKLPKRVLVIKKTDNDPGDFY